MHALWMLVAALLFSVMGVCVKLAGVHLHVGEIVLYRSLFGLLALGGFALATRRSLATPHLAMHLRRGAVGSVALSLWFYATTVLPLGTAMTLNYTSPLFIAAFTLASGWWGTRAVLTRSYGGRRDWPLVVTVAAGFAGVLLVLRPSFVHGQEVAAIGGLASGVLSAAAYWHVKHLGRLGEPEWRIVFYFAVSGSLLGLALSLLSGFSAVDLRSALLLLAVGVSATAAQLALTRAFGRGSTLLTASLQYSAVLFASLLGVLVFGDHIPPSGWLGIAIILAAGVAASAYSALRARATAADVIEVPPADPLTEALGDRR